MKSDTLKTRHTMITRHRSHEGPREVFTVYFQGSSRTFLGAPGVLNFLEGDLDEYEISQIGDWIGLLDFPKAA